MATVADRAEALAQQFDQAVVEFNHTIEALSDAQWRLVCPDEGRPVGVVAHHVAGAIPFEMGVFRQIAAGEQPDPIAMERIHLANERHARRKADCTRQEVLALLHANALAATTEVREWSDEQLTRTGHYIAEMAGPRTVEAWLVTILIGHIKSHLRAIQATLAAAPP